MRICILATVALLSASSVAFAQQEIPKVADARLVVELVAQAPDIVHPVSCDFDHQGRLLVIESHTHFAPKDYKGPKHDVIKAFDVKTGKARTFFEGTKHTMDLAVHPDGAVYVATRNEILRLRETKAGVKSERIVFMETKGDYPHNGLSGLCFDSKGDLTFGMGENLGVQFKLIGADGVTLTDEQGGHIFHCSADGKKLRRVATGFWNPFGICRDIYGRVFAVDNDPDQSPPCRMLHVVEGGDYGFRFCYGRSGKHPFQSWHGELPGTLPMMTGVGESPCEILSYESDGLPKEYLGKLMVTSWADHRVELYKVIPHGASFKAERQSFVQGGNNFRPVGLCVAPDGSLYVTDWVLSNYNLHGKGAIWRIRWKDAKAERSNDPKKAIYSMHRPLREWAAHQLGDPYSKYHKRVLMKRDDDLLRKLVKHDDARVRAAIVTEFHNTGRGYGILDADFLLNNDPELSIREMVISPGQYGNGRPFLDPKYPAGLRAAAASCLVLPAHAPKLLELVASDDPFLRHAAVQQGLAHDGLRLAIKAEYQRLSIQSRVAYMQMQKQFDGNVNANIVSPFLGDRDETIGFLAVKWIADEKLNDYRKDVEKLMADPKLSVRMYVACATALARLDGQNVNEKSLADYFANRLADGNTPASQRAMLLRQVPANHPKLTVELLVKLLNSDDAAVKLEALRALAEHSSPKREQPLLDVLRNPKLSPSLRGFAIIGLMDRNLDWKDELIAIAKADKRLVPDVILAMASVTKPDDRPPPKDIDVWMKRLDGKADAEFGARVFFSPTAGCAKCHRIDGRGADVGPDLSNIGRTDRRHLLESILQPSNNVAPHYVAWHLETADGKVRNGMLVHTQLDEYTYLDAKGDRFKVRTSDLVEQRPLTTSIMPDGLLDRLTDQEVRDLLAYLQTRK